MQIQNIRAGWAWNGANVYSVEQNEFFCSSFCRSQISSNWVINTNANAFVKLKDFEGDSDRDKESVGYKREREKKERRLDLNFTCCFHYKYSYKTIKCLDETQDETYLSNKKTEKS